MPLTACRTRVSFRRRFVIPFFPFFPGTELRGFMEEVETMKAERDVVESELKALNDPSASSNMRETFLKVWILAEERRGERSRAEQGRTEQGSAAWGTRGRTFATDGMAVPKFMA